MKTTTKLLRETIRKLMIETSHTYYGDFDFEEEVKPQVMKALSKLGAKKIYTTNEKSSMTGDWGLQIHFTLSETNWAFEFVEGTIHVFAKEDGVYSYAYRYDVPEEVQMNRTLADWLYNEMKYL